jgi:hypothetical protein
MEVVMLTYSQRKSFARSGATTLHASIDAAKVAVREEADARMAANAAEYARRTAPVPFTPEQLKAAVAIRTATGWHRVVRVNAKTVSVTTGYSWTNRHDIAKILEVRTA